MSWCYRLRVSQWPQRSWTKGTTARLDDDDQAAVLGASLGASPLLRPRERRYVPIGKDEVVAKVAHKVLRHLACALARQSLQDAAWLRLAHVRRVHFANIAVHVVRRVTPGTKLQGKEVAQM